MLEDIVQIGVLVLELLLIIISDLSDDLLVL
jgi:hypothetical protein